MTGKNHNISEDQELELDRVLGYMGYTNVSRWAPKHTKMELYTLAMEVKATDKSYIELQRKNSQLEGDLSKVAAELARANKRLKKLKSKLKEINITAKESQ